MLWISLKIGAKNRKGKRETEGRREHFLGPFASYLFPHMHAIDGKGLIILTGLLPNLKNSKQLSLASAPGLADFEAHVLFALSFSFSSGKKKQQTALWSS